MPEVNAVIALDGEAVCNLQSRAAWSMCAQDTDEDLGEGNVISSIDGQEND
jgi:hypothetical protein